MIRTAGGFVGRMNDSSSRVWPWGAPCRFKTPAAALVVYRQPTVRPGQVAHNRSFVACTARTRSSMKLVEGPLQCYNFYVLAEPPVRAVSERLWLSVIAAPLCRSVAGSHAKKIANFDTIPLAL